MGDGLPCTELLQFSKVPYLQLTSLDWKALTWGNDFDFLLPSSLFPPTLCSLSFEGNTGHNQLTNLSNLTSLAIAPPCSRINIGSFKMIIQNNRSLQTLSLNGTHFEGSSSQHPVTLENLRSFSLRDFHGDSAKILSTIIHVPAFQCLSSLLFSVERRGISWSCGWSVLCATGPDIVFSLASSPSRIMGAWQDLIGHPGPTIQHFSFEHQGHFSPDKSWVGVDGIITLFMDAHTLDISYGCTCGCFAHIYPNFWDDLRKLGPKLTTIHFKVPKSCLDFSPQHQCDACCERPLDAIEGLIKYRAEHGWLFSSVEGIFNESEKVDAMQELVWRGL